MEDDSDRIKSDSVSTSAGGLQQSFDGSKTGLIQTSHRLAVPDYNLTQSPAGCGDMSVACVDDDGLDNLEPDKGEEGEHSQNHQDQAYAEGYDEEHGQEQNGDEEEDEDKEQGRHQEHERDQEDQGAAKLQSMQTLARDTVCRGVS